MGREDYVAFYQGIALVTTESNRKKALNEAYHTFREQGLEPTRKNIKLTKVRRHTRRASR